MGGHQIMLVGKSVSLFSVEREDLQSFRDWRNNPDFRKFFREYRELNMDQQENCFKNKVVNDDTTIMFSIKSNKSNELIGCCGFVYINWAKNCRPIALHRSK